MSKYCQYINRLFIIVLILVCFSTVVNAQQAKCTILGRIVDEQQVPIAYASVAVYIIKAFL